MSVSRSVLLAAVFCGCLGVLALIQQAANAERSGTSVQATVGSTAESGLADASGILAGSK